MKIDCIRIEIKPWYQPHKIELHCTVVVDGMDKHWTEIFPDSDFESRAEQYFDLMKRRMLDSIKREKP